MPRETSGPPLSNDSVEAILSLEEGQLYRPSDIAKGTYDPSMLKKEYNQFRLRLGKFIRYHAKNSPDGSIGTYNAWYGKTWKCFLDPADIDRVNESRERSQAGIHSPPRPRKELFRWIPRRRVGFALNGMKTPFSFLIVLAVLTMTAASVAYRSKIYSVLFTEGAKSAAKLNIDEEDPVQLFQSAWVDFRNLDFDIAEEKARKLLGMPRLTGRMEPNCHLLLGEIALSRGKFDLALQEFTRAHNLYVKIGEDTHLFGSCLNLARVYMVLNQTQLADQWLEEAKFYGAKSSSDFGRYYHHKCQLSLKQQNFQESLSWAIQASQYYEQSENNDMKAAVSSTLGFAYLLNDRFSEGLKYSLQSQALTVELADSRQYHYNLVNFLLIENCQGQDVSHYIEKIEGWIQENNDQVLRAFLGLALEYCS